MMKKRAAYVCMTGIIMAIGLTACQESGSGEANTDVQIMENMTETDIQIMESMTETDEQSTEPLEPTEKFPFTDSPEFQACAEWQTFLDSYDTDGAILEQVDNEPIAGYKYEHYLCYSEEMEHKIDEICEKNGLALLSGFQVVDRYSDLLDKSGIGEFCADSESARHNTLSAYLYSDGSFMIEGNVTLAGSSMCEADYQFARNAKGTFNPAYLDFGDYTGYSVRAYTTKKGQNVYILCKADENAHILAETEKSYISINVLGDLSGISDVNDERLELLADAFDFSAIP